MTTMTVEDQIEMLKHQIASDKQELERLETEQAERYIPQAPDRTVKMVRIEFIKDERTSRFVLIHPSSDGARWIYTYDNGTPYRKAWKDMIAGIGPSARFTSMTVVDANNVVTVKTYERR